MFISGREAGVRLTDRPRAELKELDRYNVGKPGCSPALRELYVDLPLVGGVSLGSEDPVLVLMAGIFVLFFRSLEIFYKPSLAVGSKYDVCIKSLAANIEDPEHKYEISSRIEERSQWLY